MRYLFVSSWSFFNFSSTFSSLNSSSSSWCHPYVMSNCLLRLSLCMMQVRECKCLWIAIQVYESTMHWLQTGLPDLELLPQIRENYIFEQNGKEQAYTLCTNEERPRGLNAITSNECVGSFLCVDLQIKNICPMLQTVLRIYFLYTQHKK